MVTTNDNDNDPTSTSSTRVDGIGRTRGGGLSTHVEEEESVTKVDGFIESARISKDLLCGGRKIGEGWEVDSSVQGWRQRGEATSHLGKESSE